MKCVLDTSKRCHQNCYCDICNVFCIVEMTELQIVINVVCEAGKSLETPHIVILQLPLWHCPPLGLVIEGLDFWKQVCQHVLDGLWN